MLNLKFCFIDFDGLFPEKIDDNEEMLRLSIVCYERALAAGPGEEKENLLRRLGNAHNESGTHYMNRACTNFNSGILDGINELIQKSLHNFQIGIETFQSINDTPNLALLWSNRGRLLRLCAYISSCQQDALKSGNQKIFFQKAIHSYQMGRQILGNRSANPEIWDAITWELSTASFTMATLLQDNPQKNELVSLL